MSNWLRSASLDRHLRQDLRLHAHHRDANDEEPANVGKSHDVVDVHVQASGGGHPSNHGFHEVVPPEDRGNRDEVEDGDAETQPASPPRERSRGQDSVTHRRQEECRQDEAESPTGEGCLGECSDHGGVWLSERVQGGPTREGFENQGVGHRDQSAAEDQRCQPLIVWAHPPDQVAQASDLHQLTLL